MRLYVKIEAWGARGEQIRTHRGIESRVESGSRGNTRQSAVQLCRHFGLNGYTDIDGHFVRVEEKP
jgi:hypothetical protein